MLFVPKGTKHFASKAIPWYCITWYRVPYPRHYTAFDFRITAAYPTAVTESEE